MKALIMLSVLQVSNQGQNVERRCRIDMSKKQEEIEGVGCSYTDGRTGRNKSKGTEACPKLRGGR